MLEKRSKNIGSPDRGALQIYEINSLVPGTGFEALAYSAESGKQALQPFKRRYPSRDAFQIVTERRKASSDHQAMLYLVWWKDCCSLIGGEISSRASRQQMQILKDWEAGKFNQRFVTDKALLNGS